jgi:hypothetical protein
MFERLQKPFLTVETGEAYQPIRLHYELFEKDQLVQALNSLKCCEKNTSGNTWNWYWRDECADLHFESLDSYKKNPEHVPRLGSLTIRENILYVNLPSFKRACLAVPFFHRLLSTNFAKVHHADFINKVFGTDERLPHGFAELFKDDELEKIVKQRVLDYEQVQESCEKAATPEEAFAILSEYTKTETHKRLPYAERYEFQYASNPDADVVFLGFYIFLRGRELVAIRRWFGNAGYTLADASEETMEKVFGNMNIDVLE